MILDRRGATDRPHSLPGFGSSVVLALLAAVVLGPPLWHAGVLNFDDNLFFGPDNPEFRAVFEQGDWGALVAPDRTIANAYLPVSHLSLYLDYALQRTLGIGAGLAHLHSLLLHVLAAFAAARLFGRLGLTARAATLAAALFLVHPALLESVGWLAGRKDVLSGLLAFLALGAVARSAAEPGGAGAPVLAWLWTVLALYAKGTTVVLALLAPCVVGLVDRRSRRGWLTAAGVAVAAGLAAVHHASIAAAEGTMQGVEAGSRLVAVPGAFLHYVATVVWPTGLNVLYPEQKTLAAFAAALLPGLTVMALVAAVAALAWRRGRARVAIGLTMAVLAWLPFNTAFPASSIAAADRYLYLVVPWAALALVAAPGGAVLAMAAVVPLAVLAADRAADFESSETLWESSLAADPDNAVARIDLALAVLPGDPDRARALAAQAAEQARHPVHRLRAEELQRDLALQRGLMEEACRHAVAAGTAADAVGAQPGAEEARLRAHLNAAVLLRAAGRDDEAQAAFERARAVRPDDPSVLAFEAETLRAEAAGDDGAVAADSMASRQARSLLDAALEKDPDHFDALLARAHWRQARGELMGALQSFRHACRVSPQRAEPWLGQADLYLSTGDFEGAEEAARGGLSAGVHDPNLELRLGLALAGQGRLDEARQHYEGYLELRPHDAAVQRALAAVVAAQTMQGLYQRQPDELEAAAERIRSLDPDNPKAWLILGLAKRLQHDMAAAAVLFERAHQALPDSEEALRLLAETERDSGYDRLRAGEMESALDHFRRFVDLAAPGVDTTSALGILHVHWREHEKAGEDAFMAGDLARAETEFRRCLELVPEQTSACFQLGLAILQQDDGRTEEALASFERAEKGALDANLDASMPVLYEVLALKKLGRLDDAKQRVEHFLEVAAVRQPSVVARMRAAIE